MAKPTTTVWRIPLAAWPVIGLAVAAESVSNALRAYGLGTHLDRFTIQHQGFTVSLAGAVLVLASVAVSLSQARAAWIALTPGPARQRIIAGLSGVLLLAISVTAMASHILEAQRVKVAEEGTERSRYDRARAAYDRVAAELRSLASARTMAEIKAAMAAAPVSRAVFRRTSECTDVTRQDSFAACRPILDLRQEMGRAIRKAELEPEAARLKAELDRTQRPEVATASERMVADLWGWIMGFGVVFVATFGTVIFARVETVAPQAAASPKASRPATFSRSAAEQDLCTLLALGRTVPDQDHLAARWGVAKGTVSKWLAAWQAAGTIPARNRDGRRNTLSLVANND